MESLEQNVRKNAEAVLCYHSDEKYFFSARYACEHIHCIHPLQSNQENPRFPQFELWEERLTNGSVIISSTETTDEIVNVVEKLTKILTKEHVRESLSIEPRAAEVALSKLNKLALLSICDIVMILKYFILVSVMLNSYKLEALGISVEGSGCNVQQTKLP
uniref:Uncharacterized protein n=1 Tax=Romanomermis culicivorax TaxID=13658 RepID=A0A915K1D7_ROMCU